MIKLKKYHLKGLLGYREIERNYLRDRESL